LLGHKTHLMDPHPFSPLSKRRWAIMKKENSSWELYTREILISFEWKPNRRICLDIFILLLSLTIYPVLFLVFTGTLLRFTPDIGAKMFAILYLHRGCNIQGHANSELFFFFRRKEGASFEFFIYWRIFRIIISKLLYYKLNYFFSIKYLLFMLLANNWQARVI